MFSEVEIDKDRLLQTLKTNLETHKKIVAEAKAGYLLKAKELLQEKLQEIDSGKFVQLNFSLSVPIDNSKTYEQAIKMLEFTQKNKINVSEHDFRCFILDEWDWDRTFYVNNARFSQTAASGCLSKGY